MIFAAAGAVGVVYGSMWVVRQAPKIASMVTGALLMKTTERNNRNHRLARLGFDILRDLEDETFGTREFHAVRFDGEKMHPRLKFLGDVDLFVTSEELFLLKSGMDAVKNGDEVVPVDFRRIIDVSQERLNDKEFIQTITGE